MKMQPGLETRNENQVDNPDERPGRSQRKHSVKMKTEPRNGQGQQIHGK